MAKIIISGGGTGGHVFPAVAIANAIKEARPEAGLLFVGAEGRMEMERVPAAGFQIVGLPVVGIKRGSVLNNASTALKLLRSIRQAGRIVAEYKPDVVVGVGGYASFPTLFAAQLRGVPTIIAEQNCYAGVANKRLARRAKKVCVAYEGMENFFPKHKIVLTGTPVRSDLAVVSGLRSAAIKHFGLSSKKRTILVMGGSLGARTINEALLVHTAAIGRCTDVQWIWQAGALYYEECKQRLMASGLQNMALLPFIDRMDYAYSAADVVVSRAGAGAIAEMAAAGKACVLVPSPNVTEDHQTKNARALLAAEAAALVSDRAAVAMLVHTALLLAADKARCGMLAQNIAALAKPHAARDIAKEIIKLTK